MACTKLGSLGDRRIFPGKNLGIARGRGELDHRPQLWAAADGVGYGPAQVRPELHLGFAVSKQVLLVTLGM